MFLKGMASGNLVEVHIIVNRYWLPVLVFGNGPTQSMSTWLNGSSKAGMELGEFCGWVSSDLTCVAGPAKQLHILLQTRTIKMLQNFVVGFIDS